VQRVLAPAFFAPSAGARPKKRLIEEKTYYFYTNVVAVDCICAAM
jgi:hypothetical protein